MALSRSSRASVRPPRPTDRAGRASRWLVGLVVCVSLFASLAGHTPLGPEAANALVLTPETLTGLRLTALVTNAFVNLSEHPGALFLPIMLLALFRMRDLPQLLERHWKALLLGFGGLLVGGYLVNRYLVPGVWGILGAVLITGLVAPTVERMFGFRPFVWFCLRVVLVTHAAGALLLWFWPGSDSALFAAAAASPAGISPLTGAWLLTFALVMDRRRLDGLDMAINGRAFALILVVLDVYQLLFSGFLSGVMNLIGLGVAFANIHGISGPKHLLDRFRLWRLERRRARFRVVRGGRDDGRIVH